MYISKENQRLGIKLFKQRTLLTEKLLPKKCICIFQRNLKTV